MSRELRKSRDSGGPYMMKVYSGALGLHPRNTTARSVPEEKEKLQVLQVESTFWRRMAPASWASGWPLRNPGGLDPWTLLSEAVGGHERGPGGLTDRGAEAGPASAEVPVPGLIVKKGWSCPLLPQATRVQWWSRSEMYFFALLLRYSQVVGNCIQLSPDVPSRDPQDGLARETRCWLD